MNYLLFVLSYKKTIINQFFDRINRKDRINSYLVDPLFSNPHIHCFDLATILNSGQTGGISEKAPRAFAIPFQGMPYYLLAW